MMKSESLQQLTQKRVSLLRVSADEWEFIVGTRRQGMRFSLNFPHDEARVGQPGGIVLIAIASLEQSLRIGVIGSIAATSTLDSRVVFDLVSPILPGSLDTLLANVRAARLRVYRDRLDDSTSRFEQVSNKLAKAIISVVATIPENGPAVSRVLAYVGRPTRYDNARALQQDAVTLAIKAFGGIGEPSRLALPGSDTALARIRLLEDTVIEHDARWLPGWKLLNSELTGRATFERHGEVLEVFTANKKPLEELFGVDLIYFNQSRGALVMVQYKMLERAELVKPTATQDDADLEDYEWTVRINNQFKDELDRMRRFDRDLNPGEQYRLHSGAFFFKLVRRQASIASAGIIISLGHVNHMLANGFLHGPKHGLRISYRGLAGHYLRSEPFVELIRSGYIGTCGVTTRHLQTMIQASMAGGKAVVAAIQTALKTK